MKVIRLWGIGFGVIGENVEIIADNVRQIPWWNKYTLSVQEAAEYFGFSDKKVRKIIDEHENESFVLWNGTRPRIKRKLFELFIDEKLTAI